MKDYSIESCWSLPPKGSIMSKIFNWKNLSLYVNVGVYGDPLTFELSLPSWSQVICSVRNCLCWLYKKIKCDFFKYHLHCTWTCNSWIAFLDLLLCFNQDRYVCDGVSMDFLESKLLALQIQSDLTNVHPYYLSWLLTLQLSAYCSPVMMPTFHNVARFEHSHRYDIK